jgi:hypothetical protein
MKLSRILAVVLVSAVSSAQAVTFSVQARKDTVTRRSSDSQKLPRGSTQLNVQNLRYLFTVKRTSLQAPDEVTVAWMVLIEHPDGSLAVGTQGHETYDPQKERSHEVATDAFELKEREWDRRGGRKSGSLSSSVFGYGVRIHDGDGNVLGEKFSSSKVKPEIEKRLEASGKRKEAVRGRINHALEKGPKRRPPRRR